MIYHGDCLEVMGGFDDNSIDAIVTDPPYGLKFMGKKWDYEVPSVEIWEECLRVLKPGGHLLSFAGTRTYHRMAVNIEDGGFEIRDMIAWLYGSGFPKSHNISKAIDKMAGAEREVVGERYNERVVHGGNGRSPAEPGSVVERITLDITAPATPEAQQWDGWGTALKPAHEPICVARKPFGGTVASNVLEWGTGGINIDGCRIPANGEPTGGNGYIGLQQSKGWNANNMPYKREQQQSTTQGRFPANFTLSYPEDEYIIRDDVTPEQLRKLARWIDENP